MKIKRGVIATVVFAAFAYSAFVTAATIIANAIEIIATTAPSSI